jgi:hypothetical protein
LIVALVVPGWKSPAALARKRRVFRSQFTHQSSVTEPTDRFCRIERIQRCAEHGVRGCNTLFERYVGFAQQDFDVLIIARFDAVMQRLELGRE